LASTAIAYALFLRIDVRSSYVTEMMPTFVLIGVGFTLAYGPLNIAATNGIDPEEQGLAGGLVTTSFQLGGAVVLAIVAAVNTATTSTSSPQAVLDGFHAALLVPVAVAILGMGATALGLIRRAPRHRDIDAAAQPDTAVETEG
jgi:hypothetical protein